MGMINTIYERAGETVTRCVAGEVILVPIRGELADMQRIFSLNDVAEYAWRRLDGIATVGDIVSGVEETFEVGPESAAADVRDFLLQLVGAGLIKERPDA